MVFGEVCFGFHRILVPVGQPTYTNSGELALGRDLVISWEREREGHQSRKTKRNWIQMFTFLSARNRFQWQSRWSLSMYACWLWRIILGELNWIPILEIPGTFNHVRAQRDILTTHRSQFSLFSCPLPKLLLMWALNATLE